MSLFSDAVRRQRDDPPDGVTLPAWQGAIDTVLGMLDGSALVAPSPPLTLDRLEAAVRKADTPENWGMPSSPADYRSYAAAILGALKSGGLSTAMSPDPLEVKLTRRTPEEREAYYVLEIVRLRRIEAAAREVRAAREVKAMAGPELRRAIVAEQRLYAALEEVPQ